MFKYRESAMSLVLLSLFCTAARAELMPPQHATLHSAILKQERAIDVYLPKDHDKARSQKYETLYVLDGDWNAKIVTETVDFLENLGMMPPIVVVSVPNHFDADGVNSRDHDLTPSQQGHTPRSGGAADFLAFLTTELVPYVASHYPASDIRLIHGHSYGGLFLAYVIANDPAAFDGYILLDPAMGWNDKEIPKRLEEKLPTMPTRGKAVYIAGRSGEAFSGMGIDALQAAFAKAPPELPWKAVAYPAETHDSLKFKATYDALRFMYRGYAKPDDKIDVRPDTGIVAPGKPITLAAGTQMFDLHYTTDGSEPTRLSPLADGTITVADPARTRVKSISTRGEFDRDIDLHFRSGAVLKPDHAAKPGEKTPLHYAYYDEKSWPRFDGKPFAQGESEKGDPAAPRDRYAARFERNYIIPADGYYAVVLRSSQDARLTFGGREIGTTKAHVDPRWRALALPLQAGVYPARLDYRQSDKDADFQVHIYRFDEKSKSWEDEVK